MDSSTVESGENVDSNDSNIDRILFKVDITSNLKCSINEKSTCNRSASSLSSSSSSSNNVGATKSTLPVPPDGGWGWVVVFASFMINFIADGVSLSFGILFVDFVDYFGASKSKTSWVGSIFLSMPLLAGPVASYLIDRYGCQKMCIIGALLSTLSFILSIFADSLELLFLTFTIAGLGLALCYVTSIVVVAYYFEKKRSLATGLAACGTGIGTFVFPPLTIHLLEQYNWQGTLLILSGFFLNIIVFGALMRDLELPSKPNNENHGNFEICTLEDSERLCSSLVQLPTYFHDKLPAEVITELSNKEGGHLSFLLEQHPCLLNSIMTKNPNNSADSLSIIPQNKAVKKEIKKNKVTTVQNNPKQNSSTVQREPSFLTKIDAGYLRNMKLQRDSITYRGAMLNIHRYRLKASSCPEIYRNSMVTITEEKSCLFLSDLKELMLEMFDFTNFKNFGYTLFCISNFLLYICVDVPYVYIPDHAHISGTDMESASFLISVLGVFNCLGVVIVGYVGDKPWIDPALLYSGFILLSGFSLTMLPVMADYYMTASLVGIYGFTISANYTLVPVIIVHLISLDNFTGAYGLLLLVQGIASLVGPPLAGTLFDMTGNYDITFYCTGLCIIVSGAMVIPVAKSFICCKTSLMNKNDLIPADSNSNKLKFQKTLENTCVPAQNISKEVGIMKNRNIYDMEESTENSVPLLSSRKETICNNNGLNNVNKMMMYENPLSLA